MLALPLPILTFALSAVACALVWRLEVGNQWARRFFTAVFALIAAGTLLTGLRFGYGQEQFVVIQRVIPLFIGPLIYLGFISLTKPAEKIPRLAAMHLAIAGFAALLAQAFPQLRSGYDLLIGLSYFVYFTALLLLWRKGTDALAYAPLDLALGFGQWMLGSAVMLGITLIFDTSISISFAMQRSDDAIRLISIGSLISMLGAIVAIIVFSRRMEPQPAAKQTNATASGVNIKLENAARALLDETKLYLDTNLTLERLAKRLHVPARALSEALNQTQKMNVSKYVNGFRISHAAKLLETSNMSVTQIMDKSGFLTRSNFYREFERVHSQSPLDYRKRTLKT